MTSVPPGGFQWVEPAEASGTAAPASRRRRWWWAAAVLAVVVATVLAGVGLWAWRSGPTGGHAGQQALPGPPPLGTPKDRLVSFPLDRQPVAAWQVTAADVGLPADAPLGDLFASSGDKAYFVSQFVEKNCGSACRPQAGWVYGLDMRTGARLFDPVALPGYRYDVQCFGNGPGVGVCLKGLAPLTAWAIDLDHGALTFTGPTDVAFDNFPGPAAEPIGTHFGQTRLVATVRDKGVYGVGSHGERTWVVPGSGFVNPTDAAVADDIPPPTIAVSESGLRDTPDRVFSVADGKDLTPTAPGGATLSRAVVYSGGFAYEYQNPATRDTGVLFYDATGTLLVQHPTATSLVKLLKNAAMPIVAVDGRWQIFNAEGQFVSQIPELSAAPRTRMIGTKLYVGLGMPSEHRWQQWDVVTGQAGPTCTLDDGSELAASYPLGDYVGSDGTTIVSSYRVQSRFLATDMTTCRTLWRGNDDDQIATWKVGTGLLQRDLTRNTMARLRPPP